MARTADSFTKSHRVKNARQRAWNAMRVFKTFTFLHVETSAEINERNLRVYLHALHRAGYLRQVRPKRNGVSGGHIVWKLIARNPGSLAPIVRRAGDGLYDPNTDAFIPWIEEIAHDSAPAEDRPRDREETADARRQLA